MFHYRIYRWKTLIYRIAYFWLVTLIFVVVSRIPNIRSRNWACNPTSSKPGSTKGHNKLQKGYNQKWFRGRIGRSASTIHRARTTFIFLWWGPRFHRFLFSRSSKISIYLWPIWAPISGSWAVLILILNIKTTHQSSFVSRSSRVSWWR